MPDVTHIVDGQADELICPICKATKHKVVRLVEGGGNCHAECENGHQYEVMKPLGSAERMLLIHSAEVHFPEGEITGFKMHSSDRFK